MSVLWPGFQDSPLSLYYLSTLLVRFTAPQFTGFEATQIATVSLELAPGSAVVPSGGLAVSITTADSSATG